LPRTSKGQAFHLTLRPSTLSFDPLESKLRKKKKLHMDSMSAGLNSEEIASFLRVSKHDAEDLHKTLSSKGLQVALLTIGATYQKYRRSNPRSQQN
jgi:hypothetical protein